MVDQYRNGVKPLRRDLDAHQHDQGGKKNRTPHQIPCVDHDVGLEPSHSHGIAAGFAESRCKDLDDRKAERDLGNLTGEMFGPRVIETIPGIHTTLNSPGMERLQVADAEEGRLDVNMN